MKKLENLFKDFTQEKRKKQRFLFLFEPTKVVWRIGKERRAFRGQERSGKEKGAFRGQEQRGKERRAFREQEQTGKEAEYPGRHMESGEGADSGSRYAASVEINRDMKLGAKKAVACTLAFGERANFSWACFCFCG